MSLNRVIGAVLLAEAIAVATFAFGWWTVPVLAGLYAIASTNPKRARTAGLCALAGWGTLLALDFAKGPVAEMGHRLGGVMGLPSAVLYVLTLIFPALLAWSAAKLIPNLRGSSPTAPSS